MRAKKVLPNAPPFKYRRIDAGIDIALPLDLYMEAGSTHIVDSGWAFEPEPHYHLLVVQKSRWAGKLWPEANLIDNSYRGSVSIVITNTSGEDMTLDKGTYVMQLVPIYSPPVHIAIVGDAEQLSLTERGDGAFGSTG